MAFVVRNTFLDLNAQEEDDKSSPRNTIGRSSSAPPACDAGRSRSVSADINEPSPPVSTDISDMSAVSSERSGKVGSSTDSEHEEQSGSDQSSISGLDYHADTPNAAPALGHANKSPEEVQNELEMMSKAVMDMWTALNVLEAKMTPEPTPPVPMPFTMPAKAASVVGMERPKQKQSTCIQPNAGGRTGNSSRSRCTKPSAETFKEVYSVLEVARCELAADPSVLDTEVTLAALGTIATVSIQMMPNSPASAYVSVEAVAKAALLEAAAASESVYVLGYEAEPFVGDVGKGLSATLAIAPPSWERTACWETYQQGVCPRGSKCKRQHPGRDGIQPVRVLFY